MGRVVCGSEIMEDAVSNKYFFMRNMNNEHDSTKDTSMPSSILLVARVLAGALRYDWDAFEQNYEVAFLRDAQHSTPLARSRSHVNSLIPARERPR